MVFCNIKYASPTIFGRVVTILILIDGFLQFCYVVAVGVAVFVTILILIDGFLQYEVSYKVEFDNFTSQSLF